MKKILFIFMFVAATVAEVSSQQFKGAPLPIQASTFINDIRAFRQANPKTSPAELVSVANRSLNKSGINFSLSIDAATCAKIRGVKQKQADPTAPVHLGGSLKSVEGERAQLALPDAKFAPDECGGCYLDIPMLQITKSDFITLLLGQNIRFELPSNFAPVTASLLSADGRTVQHGWYLPERLLPIGISYDANVLYVAFREPDLKDLSLAIFTEGTFQVATREDADEGGKGITMPSTSASATQQIKFVRWGKTYLISYLAPCGG